MPEDRPKRSARRAKAKGLSPTTQAGAFVREEIEHVREGKHGARSAKQLIAIGLSKARRAGVDLPPPKAGTATKKTRQRAARDYARGHDKPAQQAPSPRRKRAAKRALQREGNAAASHRALSRQAHAVARKS